MVINGWRKKVIQKENTAGEHVAVNSVDWQQDSNVIKYKKSTLERQILSKQKMDRCSAICKINILINIHTYIHEYINRIKERCIDKLWRNFRIIFLSTKMQRL